MPLKRIVVIANPNSRGVSPPELQETIRFLSKSVETRLVWTEAPGLATGLASEHGSDPDSLIVACGGDGTIFEVLNGLPARGVLGILPAGTANVIARELGMPLNLKDAAKALLSGTVRKLDTGRFNGKRFLMVAGLDFDAHIASSVPRIPKKLLGQWAYHLESLRCYPFYTCPKITVEIDGSETIEGVFALVANLRRYGGGLFFAQDARPDDGLLNLVLFKKLSLPYLIKALWGAWTRRGVDSKVAYRRLGKAFRIIPDRVVRGQLDGEILQPFSEATIEVEPAALAMVVP